ncbi:hypothetical protein DV738_g5555, partial [Chaetothyriales sp. CBS 135597]
MALPQVARRGLVALAMLFVLYILLRPSATAGPAAPDTATDVAVNEEDALLEAPTRSYPPPPNKQQPIPNLSLRPVRERLAYYFPYDVSQKFPAYIWQTWKSSPATGDFDDRLSPFEASWTEKHPGFVHEVITDETAVHLISYLFAPIPEIVEAYDAMPLPVLKADFFRYLILLARGGIYSDIDTTALKSAGDWLPEEFDQSQVGLVIGIEADPDRPDWADWYARRIQFCQWTIQSKPGHPVLLDIVARITDATLKMKRQNSFKKGKALIKSIMEFTGPGVWTDAIFDYFNHPDYFDFSQQQPNIWYSDFFNLETPKRVGDVIVLPITSFSPGVNQMGAGDLDHPLAFVKHEFDGSWKPEDERM